MNQPIGTEEELRERAKLPVSAVAARDRITAQLSVHHEHFGEQPHSVTTTYNTMLHTMEQPFTRRVAVGQEWMRLALGSWIPEAGLVLLENRTGKVRLQQPTPEQVQEVAESVIEVSFPSNGSGPEEADLIVGAGRFLLMEPTNIDQVYVRCRKHTAQLTVHVYPR